MAKKQQQDVQIAQVEISSRTNIIVAVISGSVIVLLVALISVNWRPLMLKTTTVRAWYVIFESKFPANYWTEGVHSFLFDANCPFDINAIDENGPTYSFSVDQAVEIQNSIVFIRRRGLYLTEIKGDAFGHSMHPSQETAAIYSLFAISFEDAKRLKDECKVSIKIDDGISIDLTPTKVDKIQ